ncbi:achaete-scute homolog 3-like [Pecten maximus]|uniref:achaete-scute homolog 3-like n=1 Tax=Pecten maximus TaxID=6579 RepID=UPI00145858A3|nr:achaete-scute homolog 3-like [Pecten maximus]
MFSIKISSPTCEELGIPRDCDDHPCVPIFPTSARIIKNPSLHFDGLRYEASIKGVLPKRDPFSPLCIIPLPSVMAEHSEPNCIGKRNERERERVRCVNEGYSRLREHLPLERKDKRISKVDTLRKAIDYIKHLEDILAQDGNVHNHGFTPDSFAESDSRSVGSPSRSRFDEEMCEGFSDTDSNITDISDSYHRKRPLEVSDVVADSHVQCSEKRKCVHNA